MLTKAELSPIIKEVWSDQFYEELRPELGVSSLVQNKYEGLIRAWGDTVKVQQIQTPGRAQILTNDNEAYSSQVPVITNTDLVVNKSAVFPVDITDWGSYQANPAHQAEIRKMMVHEVARAVDQEVLDAIAPSASVITAAAMTKAVIANLARLMDELNIPNDGSRVLLLDPQYKEDLVQINEILSRDFSPSSSVLMSGKLKDPLYGFKIHTSNLLGAGKAHAFHPSFMQVAIQKGAEYKEMDLEASTNVCSKRARVKNLFGLKQFDAARVLSVSV